MENVVAAVLAGGRSERLGRDKRFARLGGESLLARAVRLMRGRFPRVVLSVASPGDTFPDDLPRDVDCVPDLIPGAGPLAGLHAALHATGADRLFLHACDLPFPSYALIERLEKACEAADAALPESPLGLEPLHAFYRASCLAAVERALAAGRRRVISFHPEIRVARVTFADLPDAVTALFNVNRPGDLDRARAFIDRRDRGRCGRP